MFAWKKNAKRKVNLLAKKCWDVATLVAVSKTKLIALLAYKKNVLKITNKN